MVDRRTVLSGVAGLGALAVVGCGRKPDPQPNSTASPAGSPVAPSRAVPRVADTIATGLNVPWGLAFLREGRALVAERDSGQVILIGDGRPRALGRVPAAVGRVGGEQGLLGLALDPDDDAQLFAFLTTTKDDRVVRMTWDDDGLHDVEPVLTGLAIGSRHHGGRLVFGPDGHLYVGTGDAGSGELAQNRDSENGKILRITKDGKPAPGNPFDSRVWSYGHRNVEGLAFDGDDRLWATEFGQDHADELNLIMRGRNYGWPEVEGDSDDDRFAAPKATWSTAECSPSGLAIAASTAWIAALRGERLWAVPLDGEDAGHPVSYFAGRYGRMRTVAAAPGGDLWLTTSNTDGRGRRRKADDRILRVVLDVD